MSHETSRSSNQPLNNQQFDIDHASITDAQIGGVAGGDILQNQGSGNIFKDVMVNVFQGNLSRQDYRNRQALLHKVKNYWIKGVLEHSLQQRSHIHLTLDLKPEAVIAPWQVVDQALDAHPETLPATTHLIDVFDDLGVGRSLLILGDPGSGKTTALLSLARDLTERAERDASHLIPVVFNLSSWSCRKQTIADWLVEELNSKYQVPKSVGKDWIENQNLLLLLDGLDEVRADRREACVVALNEFHKHYGPEIVVCSRSRNYELLAERLQLQAAVELRSLTFEQILTSLQQSDEDLAGLQTLLEDDPALREMAKSPLMLNIMMASYESVNDQQLLDTGLLERKRYKLFDAYINQMFQRRGMKERYPRWQMMRGLTWLARNMEHFSQTVFLIEAMHPDWLRPEARRRLYRVGVKLLFMVFWGGLHLGLIAGLNLDEMPVTFDPSRGAIGLGLGILGGILYGVIGGLLGGLVTEDTRFRDGSIINGLLLGGIFGPLFGLSMWSTGKMLQYGVAYGVVYFALGIYIYGLIHETRGFKPIDNLRWSPKKGLRYLPFSIVIAIALYVGTQVGLVASIVIGIFFNLIVGFESAKDVDRRAVPNYKIWRSAANAIKLFAIVGLSAGVTFYVAHGAPGQGGSLASGIANGLIFGVGAALGGAGGAGLNCIKHLVLRFVLWKNRYAPWNYARFLDDACDRIFLQRVGGGYVFVHRSLLEHFAQMQLLP